MYIYLLIYLLTSLSVCAVYSFAVLETNARPAISNDCHVYCLRHISRTALEHDSETV